MRSSAFAGLGNLAASLPLAHQLANAPLAPTHQLGGQSCASNASSFSRITLS
jgi:hypothetical protein